MREGKPSERFGARGLHQISFGNNGTPLLLKLYDQQDNILATLTEEKGECIDSGYVDFFLGSNCRPEKHKKYLVEHLPDGRREVLHDNPETIAKDLDVWVEFLDKWIAKHEQSSQLAVKQQVMVSVPSDVLKTLMVLSLRHMEEIETGIEDGIYAAAENPHLEEDRQQIAIAESLYDAANPRPQTSHFDNAPG